MGLGTNCKYLDIVTVCLLEHTHLEKRVELLYYIKSRPVYHSQKLVIKWGFRLVHLLVVLWARVLETLSNLALVLTGKKRRTAHGSVKSNSCDTCHGKLLDIELGPPWYH